MDFQHADPRKTDAEVHLAADRRRPGRRKDNSPELLPLLRGQSEVEVPVGSEIGPPPRLVIDGEMVLGVVIALVLLSIGAVLRFAV